MNNVAILHCKHLTIKLKLILKNMSIEEKFKRFNVITFVIPLKERTYDCSYFHYEKQCAKSVHGKNLTCSPWRKIRAYIEYV